MNLLSEASNINLPFTWGDLLIGVLLLAATTALIVLTIVLIKAVKTFKMVNALLKKNGPAIDETIKNVNNITGSVNQTVSNVGALVENYTAPDGPAGMIASIAGTVVSVIQIVRELGNK